MITRLDHTFKTQLDLVLQYGNKVEHLDVNFDKVCWMLNTLYKLHKQDQKKINQLLALIGNEK